MTYNDGLKDGMNGKNPKHPNSISYMRGYKSGRDTRSQQRPDFSQPVPETDDGPSALEVVATAVVLGELFESSSAPEPDHSPSTDSDWGGGGGDFGGGGSSGDW